MAYFHVRLSIVGQKHDETKVDLDEQSLERQFLQPYRNGIPIIVNGKTIPMSNLERIRISSSEQPSSTIIGHLRAGDQASSVVHIGGPGYEWRAAARSSDVTDQFITGPAGSEIPLDASAEPRSSTLGDAENFSALSRGPADAVFVVAGRDNLAVLALVELLRALGLRIVEWEHAVARTGLPNPYVGDVVDAGLRMAGAAVVLLTPDDLVQLRSDLLRDSDGTDERETRGQARPNVYYEAGIADTLGRDRTVILEIGPVKSFTDAAGRHVIRYDGSPAMRHSLAQRLALAGLKVDTSGQHWLAAGDVSSALAATGSSLSRETLREVQVINRNEMIAQVDDVLTLYRTLKRSAQYDDFSDGPDASLEFVFRAQAIMDRFASETSYAKETEAARKLLPHERIPILNAALKALRSESG
ncbi:MAG: TIR domain-containing protein [Jatrophihabitantaceae bacterium]